MKVKSLGAPPAGNSWSYGAEYSCRIRENAVAMLTSNRPPRLGYERVVRSVKLEFSTVELVVQNAAGDYYLASSQVRMSDWSAVFGIEIVK